MDRSWIRQMVYDSNYKKGMKIWKSGGVFALNYKCFGDGMFHIRAQVDGRYQDFYAVSIIYNAQKKIWRNVIVIALRFNSILAYVNIVWLSFWKQMNRRWMRPSNGNCRVNAKSWPYCTMMFRRSMGKQ